MRPRPHGSKSNDPIVLVEALLALLLLILFIALYVYPSQTQTGTGRIAWWTPVLLGAVALALLLVDARRRKRRYRKEMDEMIEDHLGSPPPSA